jgi:hypothetical protein
MKVRLRCRKTSLKSATWLFLVFKLCVVIWKRPRGGEEKSVLKQTVKYMGSIVLTDLARIIKKFKNHFLVTESV